jgi:hypothetical protein
MQRQRKSIGRSLFDVAAMLIVLSFSLWTQADAASSAVTGVAPVACADTESAERTQDYTIRLKSRQFTPRTDIQSALAALAGLPVNERRHMLIQFERIPTPEQRETLKAAGVELLTYVPHQAWYASVSNEATMGDLSAASVRWMGEIQQIDKISPALQERGPGPWAVNADGTVNLHVLFFKDVNQQAALALLQEVGTVEAGPGLLNDYVVAGVDPDGGINALSREDIVMWVEEVPPPEKSMNDELRNRINADPVQEAPYSLDGTDVDVGIWDGGEVDATHDDFGSRVTVVETTPPVSEHATHVAGTLGGDGTLSASAGGSANQWRGVATNVDFFSYSYLYDDLEPEEHDGAINTYGIDLSQNSWGLNLGSGSTTFGDYTSRAVKYDSVVRGVYGRGVPVFFSAGNDRNDPGECGTGYNCITPPGGTSKNTVTVGAVNSDDDTMTDFSGWGPVDDGRIKPEVVAPGEEYIGGSGIQSTEPGDTYGEKQGTSMAAPAVSGTAALIIEQFRTSYAGNDPLPSTVKALLVHGAVDLDDGTSYYNPGPDYASGYGRIDTQAAVDLVQDGKIWEDVISADDESDWYCVEVTSSSQPLKVTLAYDDPEGAVSADPALVNDLDLRVYYEGSTPSYFAWSLDPANPSNNATATTYNALDPLEQVVVNNPTPGRYFIRVWGWVVPEAPQKYSLVCEHFPFVSCDADPTLGPKIYWDEYHDTDGDTLSGEYSALAAAAASWGLTIDAKNTPITTADLSGYRLLVLPDPETALSADEVGAINSFIRSGGRLVILGEWYGPWENVTPMSAGHGITFNPDGVYDPTNNEGSDLWPHIRSFASHRLTAGLQTIALYASSSLYLHGSAIGLAGADLDAYTATMNLAEPTAAQVGDNEFAESAGAPGFVIAKDIAPNALLVIAYNQYGRGDIIAIGDSGLWANGDIDGDGIIALEEFDNKKLAFNCLTTGSPISSIMLLLMD